MNKNQIESLAGMIADRLFRNGAGKVADRLVLFGEPDRSLQYDLGGWSQKAAADWIAKSITEYQAFIQTKILMSEQVDIFIDADGTTRFIWDDALAGLCDSGEPEIRRASTVDFRRDVFDLDGGKLSDGWFALMRDIDVLLGPFESHGHALSAERAWINRNLLGAQQ